MLNGLFLQFGAFYGGSIGNLLSSWEQLGVFSYALPFLLIFAVVFGIMSKAKIFGENKGLNTVISIVIGLLALQFDFVPAFFSEIFPRVGVALSVILVLLILTGIFFDRKDNKVVNYILLGVALISFVIVIDKTFGYLGWSSSLFWYWLSANWPEVVGVVAFIVVVAAVINSVGPKKKVNMPALPLNFPQ